MMLGLINVEEDALVGETRQLLIKHSTHNFLATLHKELGVQVVTPSYFYVCSSESRALKKKGLFNTSH